MITPLTMPATPSGSACLYSVVPAQGPNICTHVWSLVGTVTNPNRDGLLWCVHLSISFILYSRRRVPRSEADAEFISCRDLKNPSSFSWTKTLSWWYQSGDELWLSLFCWMSLTFFSITLLLQLCLAHLGRTQGLPGESDEPCHFLFGSDTLPLCCRSSLCVSWPSESENIWWWVVCNLVSSFVLCRTVSIASFIISLHIFHFLHSV